MGLTINPSSKQDPKTWIGVFKEAVCRAHRLCSDENLSKNEINYIINNFEDNGYNKKVLKNITKTYTQKKLTMSKEAN